MALQDDRLIIKHMAKVWSSTRPDIERALGLPGERVRRSLARLVKMGQLFINIGKTSETRYSYIVDGSRVRNVVIDCTAKNRDVILESLKVPREIDIEAFLSALADEMSDDELYLKLYDNPFKKDGKPVYIPPAVYDRTRSMLLSQGRIVERYDPSRGEYRLSRAISKAR